MYRAAFGVGARCENMFMLKVFKVFYSTGQESRLDDLPNGEV